MAHLLPVLARPLRAPDEVAHGLDVGALEPLVRERGLAFDCELVTGKLTQERIDFLQGVLVPRGITFFGHS